jgi:hypothetical protein
MLKTSIPIEISTWLVLIMLYSSHGIGKWDKFDKLQKLHFRRQVRHQPCINNIKYFYFIWQLLVSVHPTKTGKFQLVMGLLSAENVLKCHLQSALCTCDLQEYYFLTRSLHVQHPVMCISSKVTTSWQRPIYKLCSSSMF